MSLDPLSTARKNNIFTLDDLRAKNTSPLNKNKSNALPSNIRTLSDFITSPNPIEESIKLTEETITTEKPTTQEEMQQRATAEMEAALRIKRRVEDQINELINPIQISMEELNDSMVEMREKHAESHKKLMQQLDNLMQNSNVTTCSLILDWLKRTWDCCSSFCMAIFQKIWQ